MAGNGYTPGPSEAAGTTHGAGDGASGTGPALSDTEIHRLLAERHEIAIIWATGDVQSVRPDLSEGQAWDVLQNVKRWHDASLGICWDTLEATAQLLFPTKEASIPAEPVQVGPPAGAPRLPSPSELLADPARHLPGDGQPPDHSNGR